MKKLSIVSVSVVVVVTALSLGISAAFAATSLTSAVQTNLYGTSDANTNVNVGIVNTGTTTAEVGVTAGTMATSTYNSNPETNTNSNGMLNANINIDSNDPQLNTYAQSMAATDPSISAISVDSSNVSISYKIPVKLFGFIPVHETETATVNSSAQSGSAASIHRSWWSFLASGNNSSDAQAFSTTLNARVGASASGISPSNILADIEASAQSSMQSSVSASAAGQY